MNPATAIITLWLGCTLVVLGFCGLVVACVAMLARRHRPHYRCTHCGRNEIVARRDGCKNATACPMEWIG